MRIGLGICSEDMLAGYLRSMPGGMPDMLFGEVSEDLRAGSGGLQKAPILVHVCPEGVPE